MYNDKELFDDADLDCYDYGFRNYDPQIGRFPQLDPLTHDYPHYTPYQFAGNEPIANVDLDGLEEIPSLAPVIIYKSLPKVAAKATSSALSLTAKLWVYQMLWETIILVLMKIQMKRVLI